MEGIKVKSFSTPKLTDIEIYHRARLASKIGLIPFIKVLDKKPDVMITARFCSAT